VPLLEAPRNANTMLARLIGLGGGARKRSDTERNATGLSLLRGGKRSKPSLKMSDPLAGLRHLRGGIREQTGKQFHASKWIAYLVSQDGSDFCQSARSAPLRSAIAKMTFIAILQLG
jgi:hypothetical protein